MMEFRRLNLNDLESYYANRLRALAQSPSAFLITLDEQKKNGNDFFAELLSDTGPENVIFGAVHNGRVAGTIGIFKEKKVKQKHKAVVWGMYVDVEHRGQGIGGKLLDMAVHHAREKLNVAGIFLEVESENLGAQRLYESRGFKCWGTEPKAMFANNSYHDDCHMALIFD